MKVKFIKHLQVSIVILIFITYISFSYSYLSFDYLDYTLTILTLLYFLFSGLYLFKLKPYEPVAIEKFFPYKSTFVGVGQWLAIIVWTVYGITKFYDGEYFMGAMLVIVWLTNAIEALVKNKKQRFNVEFRENKILINEESQNEILIDDIIDIEIINPNKIKIFTNGQNNGEIMYVNRIRRDLRNDFKSILLGLNNKAKAGT